MLGSVVVLISLEKKSLDLFVKELSHKTVTVSFFMYLLEACESEVNRMIEIVREECARSDILQLLLLALSMLPIVEFMVLFKPLFDSVMKVFVF